MNYIAKILLNSLYGRFGMDDQFTEVSIIHKDFYPDFENKYLEKILDKIELNDYFLIKFEGELNENDNTTHNINVGIASAITAYSRIHIELTKNNLMLGVIYKLNILYI